MTHSIRIAGALLLASALALLSFASPTFALSGTAGPGDSGQAVVEIQQYLATDPSVYPEGLVTGYYGALTTVAVQRFQCRENIVCSGSPSTTGYGRVGPITLSEMLALRGTGGADESFSADVSAPIMLPARVTVGSTTAVVSWTTSEPTYSRVAHGFSWPFVIASAPSVSAAGITATPTVVLTGLLPNTLYYFVRQSVDYGGNIQMTLRESFRTNAQ